MIHTKTVYVKNYTNDLDYFILEPNDRYFPFPIYKFELSLDSFARDELSKVHPSIEYTVTNFLNHIYFKVGDTKFRVFDTKRGSTNEITIATSFEQYTFEEGTTLNNLILFQKFKKSFELDRLVKSTEGFTGIDRNDICWTIDKAYYTIGKNLLHVVITTDELGEFHINYENSEDGRFEYIGIGYSSTEISYDFGDNIDLDEELKNLKLKKQLVENIKFKLYDIYGLGSEVEQPSSNQNDQSHTDLYVLEETNTKTTISISHEQLLEKVEEMIRAVATQSSSL